MNTAVPDREMRHYSSETIPVMRETRYDKVTSFQLALLAFLGVVAVLLLAVFVIGFPDQPLPEADGRSTGESTISQLSGTQLATFNIESPLDTTHDKSNENSQQSTPTQQIADQLEQQADSVPDVPAEPAGEVSLGGGGNPAAAEGTGAGSIFEKTRRQIEDAPENRWSLVFADSNDLKAYSRQLQAVGVEPGLALPGGTVIYLNDLTADKPKTREGAADDESRLYLAWQGGERIEADRQLFRRAGVANPQRGVILHFYSTELEQQLRELESAYNGHSPDEIRRTVFQVQKAGSGYQFVVTDQKLK